MTNKDIINFLKEHRNDPRLGGGFSHRELWNNFAAKNRDYGFTENSAPFKFTWSHYLNYFLHIGSKTMLRPVSVAFSAFVIVFGGWVAAVNTSFASVPGDFLYPVRKFADKTGYLFVSKNDQPKLGLEIANKRLEELTMIAQNNQARNLAPAINEFRQSMVEAADKLKIVDGSPKITKEIVKETGKLRENREKVEALGVVVGETKELNYALSQLAEREIKDLESRALTESQEKLLAAAREDFAKGNFSQALEKLLFLSYPGSENSNGR